MVLILLINCHSDFDFGDVNELCDFNFGGREENKDSSNVAAKHTNLSYDFLLMY